MKRVATPSKYWLACGLALGLALSGYAPVAAAAKPVRDAVPPPPPTPRVVQPAPPAPAPKLPAMTAEQIVERNVAARGGLKAWRAVNTLSYAGQLDAGGKKPSMLPFTLLVKRPNKQRFALDFAGKTSLQVYDGEHGFTYRPYLGRTEPEPFSPEEQQRHGAGQPDLEGWLIDYAAKGSRIALDGTETVEGKGDYKLKLTTRDGVEHHLWIDATTFLETKVEDSPRRIDGKMRRTDTYLRDYRTVDGLVIPFVSETRVDGVRAAHSMTVEKVTVNPPIDDAVFTKASMIAAANAPAAAVAGAAPGAGTAAGANPSAAKPAAAAQPATPHK